MHYYTQLSVDKHGCINELTGMQTQNFVKQLN